MDEIKEREIEKQLKNLAFKKAQLNHHKMPEYKDGKMIVNVDDPWQKEAFGDGKEPW